MDSSFRWNDEVASFVAPDARRPTPDAPSLL
jgi:hypothetical protein